MIKAKVEFEYENKIHWFIGEFEDIDLEPPNVLYECSYMLFCKGKSLIDESLINIIKISKLSDMEYEELKQKI